MPTSPRRCTTAVTPSSLPSRLDASKEARKFLDKTYFAGPMFDISGMTMPTIIEVRATLGPDKP